MSRTAGGSLVHVHAANVSAASAIRVILSYIGHAPTFVAALEALRGC